ncbi:branched-chain amino acid ABC transporter substrate-binding protein [Roseovarius sp. TE539]|uniref:ABC transporter substrate-binding protein n=1 Tax=Roseovarius sp. TE539 TaxID=2249812 RepID=UPI000DDE5817|nr:ABC transporter substrate-binding protein [Roseovarius sp. TE539]RBI71943.1 branched-chain amino acid ABC transporter substrate-binding protein [Roseovarius sp. TE539]
MAYKINRRAVVKGMGATGLAMPFLNAATASAQSGPITLGVVTPLSGPAQLIGNFVRHGAEIGADYINANGGVDGREIQLEFRDSKVNPNDASVAARELIGAGANLQLGTISSAVALAMGPLLESEGGVVITSGAGTDKLNHENYNPHVFRVGDSPVSRNAGLVRHIANSRPDIRKWAGIIPDHEYGRTTWKIFEATMRKVIPELTGEEAEIAEPVLVPYGSGDYRNYISQAMRLDVEGIYTSVYGGDAVTLYQQSQPFGLFEKTDVLLDSANEFLVATAMREQTPAHWSGFHWYYEANKGNPLSDDLYSSYVERTGDQYPMGWAAEAHAAIMAYAKAIEKTGNTDTMDVIAALKGLSFDSATGMRHIREEDNQAVKNAELAFIEPSSSEDSGFAVTDYVSLDGETVVEPARPGKTLDLSTL